MMQAAQISCLLLKVASRCNLSCDYCYMYEHADQTWREQPRVMSYEVVEALGEQVSRYVQASGLSRLEVVFHGGEPLLAGSRRLTTYASTLRNSVGNACQLDFSLQTNGVLLTSRILDELADADIAVSLSLDGPSSVNDRHRVTRSGASSFTATMSALEMLRQRPGQFTGVIAVIDADTRPKELFEFFEPLRLPSLDFLLPDANHLCPPEGRSNDPDRYVRWLTEAFDLWFDRYGHVPVRSFDSLLAAIAGKPSGTDAFGLGDVSLLTVETDGSYHDLDVLKITAHGGTALGGSVFETTIEEVAQSQRIEAHRSLLRADGLSVTCRACPEMSVCGGGAVPHRYGVDGFDHPTIYCSEMLSLITHARQRLVAELKGANDRRKGQSTAPLPAGADRATAEELDAMLTVWRNTASVELLSLASDSDRELLRQLEPDEVSSAAISPQVHLWRTLRRAQRDGITLRSISGVTLDYSADWLADFICSRSSEDVWPSIHRTDPMLRLPFDGPIEFLNGDEAGPAVQRVLDAIVLIGQYDSALLTEMRVASPEIQLVRDLSADSDKVVSFSDDAVPGTLYIAPCRQRGQLLEVEDVADSLIHEHRHQKLYLVDRAARLVDQDWPEVRSPWRDDPRPPSGLLHAVYVFVELRDFWRWVIDRPGNEETKAVARDNCIRIHRQLADALPTLHQCQLSQAGSQLLSLMESRLAQ
jgi:uncharacterized protein